MEADCFPNDAVGSLFLCARNKSGMEGIDRERVNQVILEASKGSAFLENEKRKAKSLQEKVTTLQQKLRVFQHPDAFFHSSAKCQQATQLLSSFPQLDESQIFLHLDMDMFFCAVEQLDNPSLKTKPFAVGSTSMISTANYIARRYGVRAAMPGFIALKLCPNLILTEPHYEKYKRMGQKIRQVLQEYDSTLIMTSCDEASLNLTAYLKQNNIQLTDKQRIEDSVSQIRQNLQQATNGLTCSAGIAHTRLAAKICTDVRKPDGQFVLLGIRQHTAFFKSLPLERVPGIGKYKQQLLREALKITVCGEVLENAAFILDALSNKTAVFLLRACLGLDSSRTDIEKTKSSCVSVERKSISCERTFTPTRTFPTLIAHSDYLCASLAKTLERKHLRTTCITMKLKFQDYTFQNLSRKLDYAIYKYADLNRVVKSLLTQAFPKMQSSKSVFLPTPLKTQEMQLIRLLGLRLSQLSSSEAPKEELKPPLLFCFKQDIDDMQHIHLPKKFKKTLYISRRRKKKGYRSLSIQCVVNITLSLSRFCYTGKKKTDLNKNLTSLILSRTLTKMTVLNSVELLKPSKNGRVGQFSVSSTFKQSKKTKHDLTKKKPAISLDLDKVDSEQGALLLSFLHRARKEDIERIIPFLPIKCAMSSVGCETYDRDTYLVFAKAVETLLHDCVSHLREGVPSGSSSLGTDCSSAAQLLKQRLHFWFPKLHEE